MIKFYTNHSPNNAINKVIDNEIVVNGRLIDKFGDIYITLELSEIDLQKYNYCMISSQSEQNPNQFESKYYFIDSFRIVRYRVIEVTLKLDVLETYKDKIFNLENVEIVESSNLNPLTDSSEIESESKISRKTIEFKDVFTENNLILATV